MRLWATNFIIDLAFLIFLTSAVSWRAKKLFPSRVSRKWGKKGGALGLIQIRAPDPHSMRLIH